MRDLSAAHAEAFLEMMSAERGAAKNTLAAYEKDLDELSAFLGTRGATLGSAANITLMSYAGTCHIGVTTDVAAVADPDELVRCLRAGFDEVGG